MFFPFLGTRLDTFENWTLWDYLERLHLAQTLLQKERREVSGGRFGAKVLTDTSAGPLLGHPSNPVGGSDPNPVGGSWMETRTLGLCVICFVSTAWRHLEALELYHYETGVYREL